MLKPPYSSEFLSRLKTISDGWLDGRKEKGFSLGFFDFDYLQDCDIAIVRDQEQNIIAFSNIMPESKNTWATIDLMRFDHEKAQNGTMDYLFIKLLEYTKMMGKEYFDLGMAPLANVGVNSNSFVQEKLAFLVYKFGHHFYSFEGLKHYKDKFVTEWIPMYTSYSKNSWLIYTMIALLFVEQLAIKRRK